MKITFLGTNGWYDTKTGNTPCVIADTDEGYIVFDAGNGFNKVRDIAVDDKPVTLLISHLHLDHLIGLHTLPLFRIKRGIDIYIHKSSEKLLRGFLKRPFTSPPIALNTKLRFHAFGASAKLPFDIEIRRLRHSVPCYGFRLSVDGRILTYCTDTGDCSNLARLASGADLLITECAMVAGDRSPNLFHITPETAARAALKADAKKLALFHFDPVRYPEFRDREIAELAAKNIFPDTIAARDGTEIII